MIRQRKLKLLKTLISIFSLEKKSEMLEKLKRRNIIARSRKKTKKNLEGRNLSADQNKGPNVIPFINW